MINVWQSLLVCCASKRRPCLDALSCRADDVTVIERACTHTHTEASAPSMNTHMHTHSCQRPCAHARNIRFADYAPHIDTYCRAQSNPIIVASTVFRDPQQDPFAYLRATTAADSSSSSSSAGVTGASSSMIAATRLNNRLLIWRLSPADLSSTSAHSPSSSSAFAPAYSEELIAEISCQVHEGHFSLDRYVPLYILFLRAWACMWFHAEL